jgi:hypothetical protein
MARLGRWMRPGWTITSTASATAAGPSGLVPVRPASCPKTMLMATPVRNPVITE